MSMEDSLECVHLVHHPSLQLLVPQERTIKKIILLLDKFFTEDLFDGIGKDKNFLERQYDRLLACEIKLKDIEESTVAEKIADFRKKFPLIHLKDLSIMKGFLDFSLLSDLYKIDNVDFSRNDEGDRGHRVTYSPFFPPMMQYDGDEEPPNHFLVDGRSFTQDYFGDTGLKVLNLDGKPLDQREASERLVTIARKVENRTAKHGQPRSLDVLQIVPDGLADKEIEKLIAFGNSI